MKLLLSLLTVVLLFSAIGAQERGLINNSNSPHMRLKTVNFADVHWTEGFWADKVSLCVEEMIPNLGRLMEDPEIIHAYDNFLVAAGVKEGEFRGWSFHDGDFYKYIEVLTYAYELTKDEQINDRLDEIIGTIGKAQSGNGYLHTMNQIGHGIAGFGHEIARYYQREPDTVSMQGRHEFYNFGHLMTAACVHKRITGKDNFLDIAKKVCALMDETFPEAGVKIAEAEWNPPHYMGLVEMYRTTGEEKYLDLARRFVDSRGKGSRKNDGHRGLDHSQRRVPIREETEAVGHAGHANYLYGGVTDLYGETGDESLLVALEQIWENVVTKKMYLTGATGPNHFGASDRHDFVTEAYGSNYELPNLRAYNETCANIGNAMWNYRMYLLKGEARFAEVTELALYNSAISGISLDGKHFFYTNPLRYLQGHPQRTKDGGKRGAHMSVFCCPPNIIRTIANSSSYAYNTSEDGIWVNMYGSNELSVKLANGTSVKMIQTTNYPWEGLVEIEVIPLKKAEFTVHLRIPAWAEGATVKVNEKPIEGPLMPESFFALKRSWRKNDKISLSLPMRPRLLQASPDIEETRNHVAVKYGPLVYCLESIDLPAGTALNDVVIPQDINFTSRFEPGLLGGVRVLEGKARVVGEKWNSGSLYAPLKQQVLKPLTIKMIPYFAWANRGASDMSVWLPLQY